MGDIPVQHRDQACFYKILHDLRYETQSLNAFKMESYYAASSNLYSLCLVFCHAFMMLLINYNWSWVKLT